ncbi:MAG: DUF3089 domain-containing protein [Saprospiraceae bacterium]|nr:DUF3089 domain-containing protein [Saprospiraceae bacterium]
MKKLQRKLIFLLSIVLWCSCAIYKPKDSFNDKAKYIPLDYKNSYYWAALPFKVDSSDRLPGHLDQNYIPEEVDIFFLHPTTYFGSKKYHDWNAEITDTKVNESTDKSSILYQASIFNGTGRVFAPRYRQAHYNAFFTKDSLSAEKAFNRAYEDIYQAFLYYFDHWNNNRPIIIAAHSQGALMGIKLLKEVFDNEKMKNKLVVAYIVGYPVPNNTFRFLKACENEHTTSCICSWRTYKEGFKPKFLDQETQVIITNPLSWTTENKYVGKEKNLGAVIDMKKDPLKNSVSAQIYKNILWCNKPKFKGSFFYLAKNFHKGDYNLFYMNVRENSRMRVRSFYK